jgi:elongation factor P
MFEMDGQLLEIVNVEHIKLARAGAVIKAKLRNLRSGSIFEQSFRSGDKYRSVRIDKGEAAYLYGDGDFYHFLDSDTYEEVVLGRDLVADLLPLMKEGAKVSLLRHLDTLIGVELPITVELAVAQTDPGLRGDTVSGATKPARLETGATVQVPLFVGVGDVIRVDTRTGNYMERV